MLKKIVITLSLILWPINLFLNFNHINFTTENIFKNDYQGEQLVIRNIHLYPTPLFARIFQNKPRIYIYKYVGNFLALTDPNNYFFALHPEPLTGNLNLFKYPFLDIVFFFIGLFYLERSRYKNLILIVGVIGVILLATLKVFEGLDFIIWIPISLIIVNGIDIFEKQNKKAFTLFSVVFILFSVPEIIRCFFAK